MSWTVTNCYVLSSVRGEKQRAQLQFYVNRRRWGHWGWEERELLYDSVHNSWIECISTAENKKWNQFKNYELTWIFWKDIFLTTLHIHNWQMLEEPVPPKKMFSYPLVRFLELRLMYMTFNSKHSSNVKRSYRSEIQQIVELLVCFHCSHSLLLFLWPFQSQQVTTAEIRKIWVHFLRLLTRLSSKNNVDRS